MHTGQARIKAERSRFNVINCGRRFGKDILSIDLLIDPALEGYPVAWFQPTYKSLLEVWRAFKRILKPVTAPRGVSEQDKRIELITGGVIDMWSLDGDPECSRGRKYKRVVINEAAKVRNLQLAWEQAIRANLADFRGDAYFPSTPRGRDYYHELYQRGEDPHNPAWMCWKLPTWTNPHIHPDEIEDMRRDMPATAFSQEIEAEFLDVGGRFFDEWEPTRKVLDFDEATGQITEREESWHVCDPFPIPKHWPCWGAVDYGTSSSSKTWYFLLQTIDENGTIHAIDEEYEAGLLAPEQAQRVLDCLERNGLAEPADPNNRGGLWKISPRFGTSPFDYANTFPPQDETQRLGKYPVEYYWDRGLTMFVPAVKDRRAGWGEVKRLHHDFRVVRGEDGEETTVPMFRAFKGRCSDLIRTAPILIRSDKDPEDIEGGNARGGEHKQEDHPWDTCRYGAMTRPRPAPPDPNAPRERKAKPFRDELMGGERKRRV